MQNTQAGWLSAAVFVVRLSASFWLRHISCPSSLLVWLKSMRCIWALTCKFRNWINSDVHTSRRCSVTHASRFIHLLRIKHAVTQEREAVPLLLPFSFTSFLSSIRFGNRPGDLSRVSVDEMSTHIKMFCSVPFLSLSLLRAGPFNFLSSEQTDSRAS